MTRTIECDVCGEKHDITNSDTYFVLQIPHRNLDEQIDEPLVVDLCSAKCLMNVVTQLGGPEPEPEVIPEPTPEPQRNGRLRPRSEQVTPGETHYEGEVTVR